MPGLQGGVSVYPSAGPAWCGNLHNETLYIAPGDPGILRTAHVMRTLIERAAGDPLVRDHAERAVVGIRPGEPMKEARSVYDYLAARVNYRKDPITHEWIQTPQRILGCQLAAGRVPQLDCDDLTTLSLSLLASLGHDVRIRVVSTRADREYNHVYGLMEMQDGAVVVPIDLTRAWLPPTVPWPRESRAVEIPV